MIEGFMNLSKMLILRVMSSCIRPCRRPSNLGCCSFQIFFQVLFKNSLFSCTSTESGVGVLLLQDELAKRVFSIT